ncbi:MAG: hypothetical protein HS117_14985 [Verrucomicrobiaceae bacterium]|nr:hypothetical protein [Verrucomicrobiaceae bacterium]
MFKALDRWLLPWLKDALFRPRKPITDLMLCVCDHFEPFHHTDKAGALRRMDIWQQRLPEVAGCCEDHDGRGPKHTFFYPVEQYDAEVIGRLAEISRQTCNEVEIHLHHDRDTAENLERSLAEGCARLRSHGLLGGGDRPRFGFIHGNWALDDSDPEGRGCGVRGELAILRRAGCYADMTMPSAPHPTQAPVVNLLYYAQSGMSGCSHHRGHPVRAGNPGEPLFREREDQLLLVQGPLCLDFERRKIGFLPGIENSDLGPANPPSMHRARLWMRCGISVVGAESWVFVKLHTHGAPEKCHASNLGSARVDFHRELAAYARETGIRLHHVSARELVNILHAAEDGHQGDAGAWRDHLFAPPALLRG